MISKDSDKKIFSLFINPNAIRKIGENIDKVFIAFTIIINERHTDNKLQTEFSDSYLKNTDFIWMQAKIVKFKKLCIQNLKKKLNL